MYLGVDIGGTKTLIAALDRNGVILKDIKIPTAKKYPDFLKDLKKAIADLGIDDFWAAGVAAPGKIDRERGVVLNLGNLAWRNVPIQADVEKLCHCPVVVENDANLAGLSEAMLNKKYEKVLYITVSTGIGTGFIYRQTLDPTMLDSEGGHMMLPYKGKLTEWEQFASGRAIVKHFGKRCADIDDKTSWKFIARNLSLGVYQHIAVLQPDLIVIGGSVGTYFDRYGAYLTAELKKYEVPLVTIPPVVAAQRPEKAVVYGCYDLAKALYGKHH